MSQAHATAKYLAKRKADKVWYTSMLSKLVPDHAIFLKTYSGPVKRPAPEQLTDNQDGFFTGLS